MEAPAHAAPSHKPYLISIVLHKAHNLPKADTLGKIDAYVKIHYGKKHTETKVVKSDYSPKWNKTFVVHADLKGSFDLELWDKDLTSDEHIGNVSIPIPSHPVHKAEIEWDLKSKYRPHDHKKSSTLTYSIGWIRDLDNLTHTLQQWKSNAKIADKKRAVLPIGKNLLGASVNDEDVLLCVEYEKGQVDIKLWETTKNWRDKKLFELAYSYSGIKYKCRKKTWERAHSVAGYHVFSEIKLDDIPFYYDFSKLTLSVCDCKVLRTFTGTEVYNNHGWTSAYGYEDAKKHVKNISTNDKHKTITMLEDDGVFVVDFDSDNIDFMWGVYVDDAARGVVADMTYAKQKECKERVYRYFGKPKDVAKAKIGMNIQIDDIKGGEPIRASDFEIKLYQRENPCVLAVASFLPLV